MKKLKLAALELMHLKYTARENILNQPAYESVLVVVEALEFNLTYSKVTPEEILHVLDVQLDYMIEPEVKYEFEPLKEMLKS